MSRLPVYILAGGRSSRFGSDKARAEIDGRPMIQRLAELIQPVASHVTIVADQPGKYDDLGLNTIADVIPDRGPLGGLHTAFEHMKESGWLLLLSCDLLEVKVTWVNTLMAHAGEGARAVAFRPDDRWQPLLAVYHSSMRAVVERRLAESQFAMQALLNEVGAIETPRPADWPPRLQINTLAEWEDLAGKTSSPDA